MVATGIAVTVALVRGGGPGSIGSFAIFSARQSSTVPTGASGVAMQTLDGRWIRPDGGYVLEIRGAAAGGTIQAVYLNPRPINVARAEAIRDGGALNVFVELRAPNYPGSTYTLRYDPTHDELRGTYFQAALGQTLDVVFVRLK